MRKAEEKNGVEKYRRLPSTCDLRSRRPEKYRRNYGQLGGTSSSVVYVLSKVAKVAAM